MRLDPDFVFQDVAGEKILIPVGMSGDSFHGVMNLNQSAGFIVEQLQNDTTKEEIIEALSRQYEGDTETFERAVDSVLTRLRKYGALQE